MAINLQPNLENELVLLRPLKSLDFEALYEVASDPEIWKLHQNPDRYKKEIFTVFFDGAMASKAAFGIIDKKTNTIIGSSRFRLHNTSDEAVEIGWTFLSKAYWGGTYNTSFKNLMIQHAFQYFRYVLFHVDHKNYRSQRAVQKLGAILVDKQGFLKHLSTTKETGITFMLDREIF